MALAETNNTGPTLPNGHLGELVRELQQLRWASDAAQWTLLKRCQQVEAQHRNLWRSQFASFDKLLSTFDICTPVRYREFVAATDKLGDKQMESLAKRIGLPATLAAATIENDGRREVYIEAADTRAGTEAGKGVLWSPQEAKRQCRQIAGTQPKDSAWNGRKTELDTLRAQNAELHRKVKTLEAQVATRDKEIAKLKAAVGRERKGPKARK